jgi:hypothetical protein
LKTNPPSDVADGSFGSASDVQPRTGGDVEIIVVKTNPLLGVLNIVVIDVDEGAGVSIDFHIIEEQTRADFAADVTSDTGAGMSAVGVIAIV